MNRLENHAAERAVIGAVLKDAGIYWSERAKLRPELFALPVNRDIVKAIVELASKGRDFPVAAIINRVPDPQDGPSVAGMLASAMADSVEPGQAPDLISDLHELWCRRELATLGSQLIKASTEPGEELASERLEKAIASVKAIGASSVDQGGDSPVRAVNEMLEASQAAFKRRGSDGIPWFLREIRKVTGDELEYGWLIGDSADSGGGKTSLALQQAYSTAGLGIPVLMLSGDQHPRDCFRQIAAQVLGVQSGDIRSGRQSVAEFEKVIEFANGTLKRLPIYISKINRPKMSEIAGRVRQFKRMHGRGLVIVDHAGKIYPENTRTDAGERYNQIFADAKDLAASTDMAMLMLMQRNSNAAGRSNHRPIDIDIPGGPGVRQNFDCLFSTYFEERWLKQDLRVAVTQKQKDDIGERISRCTGRAELIGMKARFGPEGVTEMVKWEASFTRYVSFTAERAAQAPELFAAA